MDIVPERTLRNAAFLTAGAIVAGVMLLTWPTHAVSAGAKGKPNVYTPPPPPSAIVRQGQAPRVLNQRWMGPRNYYFERGTGQVPVPAVVHGRRALPALRETPARPGNAGRRDNAGSVGSPERLSSGQVRQLQQQLPSRRHGQHIVNPAQQWSHRDSSGIRFGVQSHRVPVVLSDSLSTSDQAGRVLTGRINERTRSLTTFQYDGPQPGLLVRRSFDRYHRAAHRGRQYLVADGIWYRPWNGRFQVVLPPVGLVVSTLPDGFNPVLRSGVEYFVSNGVQLRQIRDGYVVVNVPADGS